MRVFEANVSSQTDPAVQAQAALRVVLVRATGARDAANDPALAGVLAQAQTYVLATRPGGHRQRHHRRCSTPPRSSATSSRRAARCGAASVPVLLVILTGGPASGAFETRRQVEGALDAAGNRRGQPITVARPEALNLPTTGDISPEAALAAAQRLRADGVLVGYGDAVAEWRHLALVDERAGRQREPGTARSKRACMARPMYSCAMRCPTRRCPKSPILVEIEGVPTLKEYARAVEILGEAPGVRGVQLAEVGRIARDVLGADARRRRCVARLARRQRATGTNGSHGRRHARVSPAAVSGAPMLRHLPNFICLVRIALIWPTIDALYAGHYWTALILVAVCAVSDGLDGWLAKRFNWTSHLGKILDPLADKLLLVALFLTATWMNLLPWWLTAVAVARDVMIGFGAVIFRFWFGPLHGRPTLFSKINTGMQLAVALAAILGAAAEHAHSRDGDRARHRDAAHHHRVGRRLSIRLHAARARDLNRTFRCDS